MPRIRTIKPEFWQDEKLAPCDPLTRLVFLGLVSLADDAGRLLDNIRWIDAQLFMSTSDTAHEALMRLSGMGRIRRGKTASGQHIIEIVNWSRHQKIQHANLKAALPEIVEEQEVTGIHEALMNHSGGAHEALMSHSRTIPTTYDQRPVPTTNDQLSAPRKRSAPERSAPAKYPNFSAAVCDAGYNVWLAKVGAVGYAQFRAAFAPVFNILEAERPAAMPRDAEFGRLVELYAVAIRGTKAAQFVSPTKCASVVAGLTAAAREPDPERRLYMARSACGTVEEQRRLDGMAA
jgi:hypothetical protein